MIAARVAVDAVDAHITIVMAAIDTMDAMDAMIAIVMDTAAATDAVDARIEIVVMSFSATGFLLIQHYFAAQLRQSLLGHSPSQRSSGQSQS